MRSEENFQILSSTASQEGMLLQLADGSIQACNAIAQQILGVTIEQMQGYTYLDYPWQTVDEDGSEFPSELHPPTIALRTGRSHLNAVMGLYKPNGELIWLSVSSQPLFRANETVPYATVTTFIDITEQKSKSLSNQNTNGRNTQVILCVNDDDANRYVTCRILQQAGFETWEAATGREALNLAAQQPDLILLDIMLPDINGIEVCQQLKANPKTAPIPVLHLSATRTTSWDKVRGLDSGADSYLTQPVEPLELLASIRALLRIRQTQKALYRSEEIVKQQLAEIETIYASAPIGLCVVDTEFRFVRINACLAEMNGLPASEHIGHTLREILPEMADRLEPLYRQVIESAEAILNLKVRGTNRAKPGIERDWSISLHPLKEKDGRAIALNVTVQDISEQQAALQDRQHAEIALSQTNSILQAVIEGTDDVIFVKDLRGLYVIANQSAADWLNVTVEEIIGKDDTALFVPNVAESIMQIDRQVISTGKFITYAEEIPKQGKMRSLLTTKYPWRDSTGNILGVIGISRDISDLKQAEAELKQSEERYRILTELSPQVVWQNTPDGRITYVNQYWLDYSGLTMEETDGDGWASVIHPDDRDRVLRLWNQALAKGTNYEDEFRLRRAEDGEYRTHFSRSFPVHSPSGEILKWIGIALDIHDRKQAEETLQESEARWRRLILDAPMPIILYAEDGEVLLVNQMWTQITGYQPDEISTVADWTELAYGDKKEEVREVIDRLYELDRPVRNGEYIIKIRNGANRIWDFSSAPLGNLPDGRRLVVSMALDVTERREAELQLQQLNENLEETSQLLAQRNQELDNFAYIVSHDLKAPLRAIANLSVWLEEDLQGQLPKENQHQMELLRNRVYRMESLIDGLLQYSRVGRTEVAAEMVNVRDLLFEIVDSLAPPVTFAIEIQQTMPTLFAKQLLLSQVFSNLISNAIKHHDRPNGKIVIGAIAREDCYEFSVSDDGPGIALSDRDRVFEIFQTLKSSEKNENTGIGLSIVKKIVETEGGEITLKSELGKGTTFRFTWLFQ
jgi:PAS domain S-box-containing protein